jgi:hypothetical protein
VEFLARFLRFLLIWQVFVDKVEFLVGFLQFLLIWQVLVDKIVAMDSS